MARSQRPTSEIIATNDGPVIGLTDGVIRRFLGIPYAAPPVGPLRWKPPVPPEPWTQPLLATSFGHPCAQNGYTLHGFGHLSDDEDCLYLNVFTPIPQDPDLKLPTMVLFPGGGFVCGASNDYDPTKLVEEGNIVFVSLNYRLGVFGFFSHPAINGEDHAQGNYGILDQQAALTWVQQNIGSFGGDPTNVTIMGQSAGGASVMLHMVSPLSKGLFHKAIIQSGGSPATIATPSLRSFEWCGIELASISGCPQSEQTPDNLRAIPTAELLAASLTPEGTFGVGRYPYRPMEDGVIVPYEVRRRLATGEINRVPILIGVNKDEFAWFHAMKELSTGQRVSATAYPQIVKSIFEAASGNSFLGVSVPPDAISQILERYPLRDFASPSQALATAIGDAGIISNTGRRTLRILKASQTGDIYAYEFDVPDSPVAWPEVSFPYGSAHGQELQYLFPLFHGGSGKPHPLNQKQEHLAKHMVRYWTTFARQGSPNTPSAAGQEYLTWPIYESESDVVVLLQSPKPICISGWGNRHNSDFWDRFYV